MKVNYIFVSFNTNNFLIDYMNKSLILILLQSGNDFINIFLNTIFSEHNLKKSYWSFVLCNYLRLRIPVVQKMTSVEWADPYNIISINKNDLVTMINILAT